MCLALWPQTGFKFQGTDDKIEINSVFGYCAISGQFLCLTLRAIYLTSQIQYRHTYLYNSHFAIIIIIIILGIIILLGCLQDGTKQHPQDGSKMDPTGQRSHG
jgi:hypothetical protein